MGKHDISLDHHEIWDDSSLVDSWNQALEEYKKYHSMHARGIKLEQLEEEVEASAARRAGPAESSSQQPISDLTPASEDVDQIGGNDIEVPSPPQVAGTPNIPGPPPQVLLGSVKDENLKKLLMAWYYAGYYTGLFEGGQQAQQHGK